MHVDQIRSSHKPMHIHRDSNFELQVDGRNWSKFWTAWTWPNHHHLYKFQQLHSPFPWGQDPKEGTDRAELPHHHLERSPCQGLETAVQKEGKIRDFRYGMTLQRFDSIKKVISHQQSIEILVDRVATGWGKHILSHKCTILQTKVASNFQNANTHGVSQ